MRVMSCNVNQFVGNNDVSQTPIPEALNTYAREIIALTKGFLLGNKEGIVILQEIPFWDFESRKKYTIFKEFSEAFSKYKMILPQNVKARFVTLSISHTESGWDEDETHEFGQSVTDFKNRFVEMKHRSGIQLIGLHMPINPKQEQENKQFWETLIQYSSKKRSDRFMMAGDFNAHIGSCNYQKQYVDLLAQGYIDVIPDGTVTYFPGKTTLDHILISLGIAMGAGDILPEEYSDHGIIVSGYLNEN